MGPGTSCYDGNESSWDDGGLFIRIPYIRLALRLQGYLSTLCSFLPYGPWSFHLFSELPALGSIYILPVPSLANTSLVV